MSVDVLKLNGSLQLWKSVYYSWAIFHCHVWSSKKIYHHDSHCILLHSYSITSLVSQTTTKSTTPLLLQFHEITMKITNSESNPKQKSWTSRLGIDPSPSMTHRKITPAGAGPRCLVASSPFRVSSPSASMSAGLQWGPKTLVCSWNPTRTWMIQGVPHIPGKRLQNGHFQEHHENGTVKIARFILSSASGWLKKESWLG